MYPASREFLSAIRSSHTIVVRATAYRAGVVVPGAEDLPVLNGTVRVDGKAAVRRTLEGLTIADPSGEMARLRTLLDVEGTEIQISRGVQFATGRTELVPVGRFRLAEISDELGDPGTVECTGQDLMVRVLDDRFLIPRAAPAGQTIVSQITALITESIPGAIVHDASGSAATLPAGIVWERERVDAVTELAAAIGCVVYCDPQGQFRIDPVSSLASPAVWLVNAGSNAVLLGGTRASTRDGVYNVVVASSSPVDGEAPVYGVAQDNDPTSPTFVGGPYGRVPRFYTSPLIATAGQAQQAAEAILSQTLGRRGTLTLTSLVNPALDAGDRIDAVLPDGSLHHTIVDGLSVPLAPDGVMPIQTRSTLAEVVPE